jgi:hypothetical protein
VKILRICLLMLIAVLLPIRGAMAGAMVCPLGGTMGGHAAQHVHDDAAPADHTMHMHGGTHHGHDAPMPAQGHDACPLCAAFCSATPMPISVPAIAAPSLSGTLAFHDEGAAAPTFLSSGPERPPRSI